jgi:hypothetical protein
MDREDPGHRHEAERDEERGVMAQLQRGARGEDSHEQRDHRDVRRDDEVLDRARDRLIDAGRRQEPAKDRER